MKAYTAYALLVLGLWAVATWKGWDFGAEKRGFIPQNVLRNAGGQPAAVIGLPGRWRWRRR